MTGTPRCPGSAHDQKPARTATTSTSDASNATRAPTATERIPRSEGQGAELGIAGAATALEPTHRVVAAGEDPERGQRDDHKRRGRALPQSHHGRPIVPALTHTCK